MNRQTACLILLSLALTLTGCVTVNESGRTIQPMPEPAARVDRLSVLTSPAPINLDDQPGADGMEIHLYMYKTEPPDRVLPAAPTDGHVEIFLYDGRAQISDIDRRTALKQWTFTAEQLQRFRARDVLGINYAMQLAWGDNHPQAKSITLIIRYVDPTGRIVYAAPTHLAIRPI